MNTSLRRAVWALAAIGLVLRLAFAMLPLAVHLVVLEDDAWMVTAIARNFALGRGITADGANPTNGFQPLYPLTLGALPYLAAPNALDAGFTANLIICALLNTLALWPLWWLARRFGGQTAGLLAVTLFALNPYLIYVSVNAMETSLGLLLLLTLFMAFYQLDLTRASHVLTLARLDASLAFAAIAVTLVLRAIRRPTTDDRRLTNLNGRIEDRGSRIEDRHLLSSILDPRSSSGWWVVGGRSSVVALYVVATLAFLAPYFAFNYSVSGTFGPSSGAALAYMHSYGPGLRPGDSGNFNLTNGMNALFQTSAVDLTWVPSQWIRLLIVAGFAGLLALVIRRRLLDALPLLLYLPIPPLYYGYVLTQARERYFVGLSALLLILIAWLGAELWRRRPRRSTALALR